MDTTSANGTLVVNQRTDHEPKKGFTQLLIGQPLQTADAPHQTIGKAIGLAVFASDALSSTAYATQEIMTILAVIPVIGFQYVFPISLGIVLLMAIVTISYEQTIHAYPSGGGAYIVARDNLGELPAQTAGAALLTDYILTVAVSISSGVAQIVSAFPGLYNFRVLIAVAMVFVVMLINLRGVKESGNFFAIPTYFFVITMFITVIFGFFRFSTGNLGTVVNPPESTITMIGVVTPFLLLHAFASGTSALTGIEAISNGITAFKEPRSKNAGITLIWMSGILGTLFLSISFLSGKIGAVASDYETVISQLARTVFGNQGFFYLAIISGTAVILFMAANTAFADFPRLSALHAGDGFLPRQLTMRGSRLVYSRGIITLAVLASLAIVVFQANVTRLIALYAIGVFLSFTLSQLGMARRWWKSGHLKPGEQIVEPGSIVVHDKHWILKMIINGFGSICTFVVMIVFGMTKFKDGAWIIITLIPILVIVFFSIHQHYKNLAKQLSLENRKPRGKLNRNRVIIPISGVHSGTLEALRYAHNLSDDITAVHISIDEKEAKKVEKKWESWGEGIRLLILESPYRLFLEPFLTYIDELAAIQGPNDLITIVVPQFIPKHWWTNFLHTRTAETLRKSLLHRENIVITEVPYQLK